MHSLRVTPPYDFEGMLAFFAARAIPRVESIEDGVYRRVLRWGPAQDLGWIEVRHAADAIEWRMSESLQHHREALMNKVAQVLDVQAQPAQINAVLKDLALDCLGLRLPGTFDPFEISVRAVLGQQITVKAARTLAQRLVQRFGSPIDTPFAELDRAFPSAHDMAGCKPSDFGELGIIARRSLAIVELARLFAHRALSVDDDPEDWVEQLCAIPGIGPWTANYIVMRACSHPDRWLAQDVVLLKALNLPKTQAGYRAAQAVAQQWAPWRSYAVLHLWRRSA